MLNELGSHCQTISNIFVLEKNGSFKIHQKFSYAKYVFGLGFHFIYCAAGLFLPSQSALIISN
ncbi:hypothetical protein J699_01755 [Acinetobacter sp. 1000160]|nr:hypothetical protein J522_0648 [Acinetobacter baumannii 146457]EYT21568.1 hypothetical protein J699_01755 [Acinetobacter sp. 1000160]